MKYNGKTYWPRQLKFVVRDAEWVFLFRDGKSYQQIATQYGVSRERVRQCFARLGLATASGGYALGALTRKQKARQAKADRLAAREARLQDKFGVSIAQWDAIGKRGRQLYNHHYFNTLRRGIEWKLTLAEWWRIWQESGHWDERGRGTGYCMARWADDGPYSTENVYICTNRENIQHSYITKPAAGRREKAKKTLEAKRASF